MYKSLYEYMVYSFSQSAMQGMESNAVKIPITPEWENTSEIRLDLSFSGGKAECWKHENYYLY